MAHMLEYVLGARLGKKMKGFLVFKVQIFTKFPFSVPGVFTSAILLFSFTREPTSDLFQGPVMWL